VKLPEPGATCFVFNGSLNEAAMAKKSSGKNKLPKRVAGVKIPKPLRRGINSLTRAAKQPIVSEAVTAALLAAAGALAKQENGRRAAKAAGLGAGAAAIKGADGGKRVGLAAALAAAEIARRVIVAQGARAKAAKDESDRRGPR